MRALKTVMMTVVVTTVAAFLFQSAGPLWTGLFTDARLALAILGILWFFVAFQRVPEPGRG